METFNAAAPCATTTVSRFISAKIFAGAFLCLEDFLLFLLFLLQLTLPGFHFRTGAQGVGYYINTPKRMGEDTAQTTCCAAAAVASTVAASSTASAALGPKSKMKKVAGPIISHRESHARTQQTNTASQRNLDKHACPFSALHSWGLEIHNVVGNVGEVTERSAPAFKRRHAMHVMSPILEITYESKKKELCTRLGAHNVNERFLFHGTSREKAEAIITNNFCLSKVRANALTHISPPLTS